MVNTGRPSPGCENCRTAKKACDQETPSCSRCVRLGKTCGGYRDASDLIFRDQSASLSKRFGDDRKSSSAPQYKRQPSPDVDSFVETFFYKEFVSSGQLEFLQTTRPDDFLRKPILACATAVLATRYSGTRFTREQAEAYYGAGITATNEALRHPRKFKEDNTLVAVLLLAVFEQVNGDCKHSAQVLRSHACGLSMILQLRGRGQLRTKIGAALFRESRIQIIRNCLTVGSVVPEFISQWSQALEHDSSFTPMDELTVLITRMSALRHSFGAGDILDQQLLDRANELEKDLIAWGDNSIFSGAAASFHDLDNRDSPHMWTGWRHEHGIPLALWSWNVWRYIRIVLSRLQEAIWRRSWPLLESPSLPVPLPQYYRSVRDRTTADLCIALAYAFGSDSSLEPPGGSVATGLMLLSAMALAGTCMLERFVDATSSPGCSQVMILRVAHHTNPDDLPSAQLAWLIDRVDYVATKVGIRHANAISRFLRGKSRVRYDIGRSMIVGAAPDAQPANSYDCLEFDTVQTLAEDPYLWTVKIVPNTAE